MARSQTRLLYIYTLIIVKNLSSLRCHYFAAHCQNVTAPSSKDVSLQLINCKCMPILLYGLECFSIAKNDLRPLDFTVTKLLIKLFRSSNVNVIDECRMFFNFLLPSEKIEKKKILKISI